MSKYNKVECTVCLSKYKSEFVIRCFQCDTGICKVCFLDYLNYCDDESVYPGCASSECSGCFLFREIGEVLKEKEIGRYYSVVVKVTLKDEAKTLDELYIKKELIEKLIRGRINFLKKEAGKGVMVVINSVYKDELYKIQHRHTKSIDLLSKKDNTKPCIRLLCKGHLKSFRNNLRCILCKTKVCIKCEKEYLTKHKCSSDDVKSVKAMNKIVKCPKCKVRIVRHTGYIHMKCAGCGQHFNYTTGKEEGVGATGKNDKIYLIKSRALSKVYDLSSDTDTLAHLRLFERSEPGVPNKKEILRIADSIRRKRDVKIVESKSDCIRLCLSIERYKRSKDKYRKYIHLSNKVEKALRDKDYETAQKLMFDAI